ncbi:VOC family protein [Streptomyces boncukensis]|uniref:2-oxoadipate dioxygenase/decarboxylase n=1 Tax=Streptomyces boncukensis TaxID=2711219 RepID=A0A6G4X2X0_9ACTN|nr:VOC family protein [Streptomyces boncukensis]NGO71482.1 VOC family protein [Streptomyces boncukensis]
MIAQWRLRAAFAQRLSAMYGREVPAYTTLVDVSREVNEDVLRARGAAAERLGSVGRLTAERHGAIRVGTPRELRQVARVFGALGMRPVGFYDLREAAVGAVPVVSTAFRPVDGEELERNPFRVFTSLLTSADPRFFDEELRARLETFLSARELFPPRLLDLADRAAAEGGLAEADAERFLRLAVGSFELSPEPVDQAWYAALERVSGVAADIGGVGSTHLNHLTPRVLDIDELYRRMTARGVEMIDTIQGPPAWAGPDVLLRQTSFRALDEPRALRTPDGTVVTGALRVRFGEVEARGIALTREGRARYDDLLALVDRHAADQPHTPRSALARAVWEEHMPRTERELAARGLGFFTYHTVPGRPRDGTRPPAAPDALLAGGWVRAEPIVYEDFLPRSAAGIFQSNLSGTGARNAAREGARYDAAWLSGALDREVLDPFTHYARQRDASLARVAGELGLDPGALVRTDPHRKESHDQHPAPRH